MPSCSSPGLPGTTAIYPRPAVHISGWLSLKQAPACSPLTTQLGINTANYSGHSFRIGVASTAAKAGLSDSLIQKLG